MDGRPVSEPDRGLRWWNRILSAQAHRAGSRSDGPRKPQGGGLFVLRELQKEILDKDALDRSKCELSLSVPLRFNRLVLVQPHYWHTAGPRFGDSVENGRLVYVMFFNVGRRARTVNPPFLTES